MKNNKNKLGTNKKDNRKFIIVDADNTLYYFDKSKAYENMFRFLSSSLSLAPSAVEREFFKMIEKIKESKDVRKRRREYALDLLLSKLYPALPEEKKRYLIEKGLKIFWETIYKTLQPAKGAREFISRASTKYNIIICSDEFSLPLKHKLNITLGRDIIKNIKGIISSEDVNVMKPSPIYIDKILKQYNISSRDIEYAIGDDFKRDLEDAKKRKIKTILIREESRDFIQAYNSIKEEGNVKADIIIRDFHELINILEI